MFEMCILGRNSLSKIMSAKQFQWASMSV